MIEREQLKLLPEEGRRIIYGDHEDFEIIETKLVGNGRWSIDYEIIVQRKDGKFFKSSYSEGATESQDERAYEWGDALFDEVFKTEKKVTVYE